MFSMERSEPAKTEKYPQDAVSFRHAQLLASNYTSYLILSVKTLNVENLPQMGSVVDTDLCAWIFLVHAGNRPLKALRNNRVYTLSIHACDEMHLDTAKVKTSSLPLSKTLQVTFIILPIYRCYAQDSKLCQPARREADFSVYVPQLVAYDEHYISVYDHRANVS